MKGEPQNSVLNEDMIADLKSLYLSYAIVLPQ